MADHKFSLCEIHENDSVLENHIKAGHLTPSRNPSCSSIIAATKRDTRAVTSQILASLHAEVPRELNRGSHYHTRFQFSKGDFVFAFKISSFNLLLRSGTPQNATRAPSQFTLLLIQPYLNVFDRALDRPFFPPQIHIISPPTETHHAAPFPNMHEFGCIAHPIGLLLLPLLRASIHQTLVRALPCWFHVAHHAPLPDLRVLWHLNLVLLQWAAAQQRAQNAPVVVAGHPASFDKPFLQIFFQKLLHEFELRL